MTIAGGACRGVWIACVLAALVAGRAGAQPADRADPYSGVVTDATVTLFGQEFYRAFSATWREQPRVERYSLAVYERPSARWGSLVWIEFSGRRVFSAFLSPGRRDPIRSAGQEAARVAYRNIVDSEVERLLFRDPDLAREEL